MILLFPNVIFFPSQPVTGLVDLLVSCHHNSLLSFLHLSLVLLVRVLGTFPHCVTSSGHKATIPPQPPLPNVLHKVQPCGFPLEQEDNKDPLWEQKHQPALSGCTRRGLWPLCFQVITDFNLKWDYKTGGRCSEMPESTDVLKGNHFSTNSPANSQGMPGGTASSIF